MPKVQANADRLPATEENTESQKWSKHLHVIVIDMPMPVTYIHILPNPCSFSFGSIKASAGLPGVILSTTRCPAGGRILKAMPCFEKTCLLHGSGMFEFLGQPSTETKAGETLGKVHRINK